MQVRKLFSFPGRAINCLDVFGNNVVVGGGKGPEGPAILLVNRSSGQQRDITPSFSFSQHNGLWEPEKVALTGDGRILLWLSGLCRGLYLFDGTHWSPIGSYAFGSAATDVRSITCMWRSPAGEVYIGLSYRSTAHPLVMRLIGDVWSQVGEPIRSAGEIRAFACDANGNLAVGGSFGPDPALILQGREFVPLGRISGLAGSFEGMTYLQDTFVGVGRVASNEEGDGFVHVAYLDPVQNRWLAYTSFAPASLDPGVHCIATLGERMIVDARSYSPRREIRHGVVGTYALDDCGNSTRLLDHSGHPLSSNLLASTDNVVVVVSRTTPLHEEVVEFTC
ncbi:MAG: hypothetical protein KDD66_13835 [Bdellovibrionales bacterium]|nr:hypothetical protein [Bdellovibrionales bacterium]